MSDRTIRISESAAEDVFTAALEISDPAARQLYLARACEGNAALRKEVESLFTARQRLDQAPAGHRPPIVQPPNSGGITPRLIHDYELIEELARGGMGVVYKARQRSLNRLVAVKMILAGRLADENEVKRFRFEAEAAASLVHPNIVSIYEVGEHEGQPYFSMRYVEGRSLHRVVEDGIWKLDDGRAAAELLAKIARAVEFAHQRGVVHRDLKPGNILIDAQREPHITDFGLARVLSAESSLTLSGSIMGTPCFMAPEQAAGKFHQLTPAADVYGLGAVLYYLLTGRPPFVAETPLDILVQVLDSDALRPRALNPQVPRDLDRICLRCLEKTPERRYPSAAALAEDLDRFLRGEPVEVALAKTSSRLQQWMRREPALVARLAALAICAVVSQVAYQVGPRDLPKHLKVMGVLGAWAAVSLICHRLLRRDRWADLARYAWAGADAILLTVTLSIVEALESPLVSLYPGLIVCSGLWLRVKLVRLTTQLCALGYGWLLFLEYSQMNSLLHAHWHFIFLVILALTGFIVAYHVHRLSILGRFSESRSSS